MSGFRAPRRFTCAIPARALRYGDIIASGRLRGLMVSGHPLTLSTLVLVPLPGNYPQTSLRLDEAVTVYRLLDHDQRVAQLLADRDAITAEINRVASR